LRLFLLLVRWRLILPLLSTGTLILRLLSLLLPFPSRQMVVNFIVVLVCKLVYALEAEFLTAEK
jgi:hypothetical protein